MIQKQLRMVKLTRARITIKEIMSTILDNILKFSIITIVVWIESSRHEFLIKCVRLYFICWRVNTDAFDRSVLVRIRSNFPFCVFLLRHFTTIDYHFKTLPLSVIVRVIPHIYFSDVGANPFRFCFIKLVAEKFLALKVWWILFFDPVGVKVFTVDSLVPLFFSFSLFFCLQISDELDSEFFVSVFFFSWECPCNGLVLSRHFLMLIVLVIAQISRLCVLIIDGTIQVSTKVY